MLTGQYSHANGIIANNQPMPKNTVTFATQLQESGYRTAYCGKWHMDQQRDLPGFDFVASLIGQGRYVDCPILLNGQETPTSGWIDDVSTNYAIEFLEKRSKAQPFFLLLGFKSPHEPRGGKNLPEWAQDLYADKQSRSTPNMGLHAIYRVHADDSAENTKLRDEQYEEDRRYMRHVSAMDACIGRVLDAIERTGHADNTIIIVTSDNGYYLGEHGLLDKRSAYEESIRVPLLIRLAGSEVPRGVVNKDNMVLNIDYAPTILDLAGVEALPKADGRSLRPLLAGELPADWRQAFRYEYFKEPAHPSPDVIAVRTTSHKLITYPGHDDWTEVFDLENDPYETRNVVEDKELLEDLRDILARTEDNANLNWRLILIVGNLGFLAVLLWLNWRTRPLCRTPKVGL